VARVRHELALLLTRRRPNACSIALKLDGEAAELVLTTTSIDALRSWVSGHVLRCCRQSLDRAQG